MDKATVTNPPVSEPGDKTNVNNNGSVPGSDLEKQIENRVRENLRAEYSRETDALKEKIAELEDTPRLSADDRDTLERLRGKKDDLDLEMRELETNPKYRAYNEKIKRTSEKAKEVAVAEAQWNMSINLGLDFVEDEAIKEGIEPDKLREELNSIVNRYGLHKDGKGNVILPHRQAKLAQRERLKAMEFTKREDAVKLKEAEQKGHLEPGQGSVRESSMEELKKRGDTIGQAKKLGL